MKRVGLIVNPIAGLGGRVGLKGSDGSDVQARALALGASPLSGVRAAQALRALQAAGAAFELVTCPGAMGASVAAAAGLSAGVVDSNLGPDRSTCDSRENKGPQKSHSADSASSSNLATTAEHTRVAALALRDLGVDLLLFAGGDGTARDLVAAIGADLPVLGIPAGVKMHSAVFAIDPRAAGDLTARVLASPAPHFQEAEVLDLDEDAYRSGHVAPRLYGTLRVPVAPRHVQNRKAPSPRSETAQLQAIAADVVEHMTPGRAYVLGPGTTTRAIAARLGLAKTLVGVDVIVDGALASSDATEADLLDRVVHTPAEIVITPIGGQGFLFGRGNQPLSPAVIRAIGRENIRVVATAEKLAGLRGAPLRVDTGDTETDTLLMGHVRVITGYRERVMYRVA